MSDVAHPGPLPPVTPANGQGSTAERERELLQAIIDAIPVMITLYEPNTRVLRLNPEFERVTGWTAAAAAGESLMERCYPDPAYREEVRRFMESCAGGWKDVRMRTRDGRDVETSWANIRLSDGRQVGIGLDLTARRQAGEALERYRLLSQHARDIVLFVGPDGRIVEANDAAVAAYGYRRDELLALRIFDLRDPATAHLVPAQMLQADRHGITFETCHRRKDGTTFPVEVSSRGAEIAGGRLLLSIVRDIGERRRAEEAVRESEARYRDLFENANDVIYTLDLDGRITSVNRRAEQTFGYVRDELVGRSAADFVPPEYHQRMRDALRRKLAGPADPTAYELEIVRRDGRRVPLEVNSRLILRDGVPAGVQGIARDITERKRAEEALRDSEARFRQLADNLPRGFIYQILQDAAGTLRFSYVSAGVERLCGLTPAEAVAHPGALYALIVPEDLARVRAREEEAYREGRPFDCQFRQRTRSGEVRWLHCRSAPRPLPGGGAVWDGIAVDVTEQKQAAEALRENEERLRLALDAGRCGVWDWDIPGDRVTWSDRIYEFHGLAPGTFGGRVEDFAGLIHPDDSARVSAAIRRAVEEGRPYSEEFRIVRPGGEVRWIATHGRVLRDDADRPVRMLGATIDVTDHHAAEEALREADRRKDEFLAMLAHELRNPLAPIRNATRVMKLIGSADANLARAGDLVERQVAHMARLVDDLLDVSRITRGKILLRRQLLDLVPLVRAAVEDHRPLLEGTGLKLSAELPDQPLWAEGDPTRLAQVAGNLLHNANKFTDAGGTVVVRLAAEPDGAAAVLSVRDTGIGMEPDILARLFEPFSQADRSLDRSRGGLGLGLALVKGLAELHGGGVRAASAGLGRGSEFTVRLPLTRPPAPAQQPTSATAPPVKSLRILVVEDNRDAAESLRLLLGLSGHEVAVAHAGLPGLEAARTFRPDVVLCDIGLPGGMDGYAVARALRADPELFGVTLIALSGYGQEEDQRKARQSGFDRHLTKPVDPQVLTQVLARY